MKNFIEIQSNEEPLLFWANFFGNSLLNRHIVPNNLLNSNYTAGEGRIYTDILDAIRNNLFNKLFENYKENNIAYSRLFNAIILYINDNQKNSLK